MYFISNKKNIEVTRKLVVLILKIYWSREIWNLFDNFIVYIYFEMTNNTLKCATDKVYKVYTIF